jgi:hypothetical protein
LSRVDYTQRAKSIESKNFEWLASEFLMGEHSAISGQQSCHFNVANFQETGKITGNFFSRARKAAWIAGFRDLNAQKQGINRE